MGEVAINPQRVGEGIAYIEALTGKPHIPMPDAFPSGTVLGKTRWAHVDLYSLRAAASLGFGGFASAGTNVSAQVLVRDYLYSTEVATTGNTPVKSFIYGAGFRVALAIYDLEANMDASFGQLAAKAQLAQKRISVDIMIVGIPQGPSVPPLLTNGQTFDVESYRQLENFVDAVDKYVVGHNATLSPLPIAATIDTLDGQKLIDANPDVRYAMWRILDGAPLARAVQLASKFPEVKELPIRTVYATLFRRPEMLRPGAYDNDPPDAAVVAMASRWINGYHNA
jgi:hypothetical protein